MSTTLQLKKLYPNLGPFVFSLCMFEKVCSISFLTLFKQAREGIQKESEALRSEWKILTPNDI